MTKALIAHITIYGFDKPEARENINMLENFLPRVTGTILMT